ncbi:oxygenase MpaB family protein [Aeromicrobium sp. Leaf350]|uniref:oxygenase MpaB family protein n=1 Tax=Aeromicrobium sp. Leaf350 TaxID=2876565 RepID=UPI001E50DEB9|nr:oxygenase MpaB family protein [Aeromicrobium sp. Leaf350]
MTRLSGRGLRRRIAALDPDRDADEIARLSLVTLHGHPTLVYALFTVAFMKQVAVPTMARILYRRGTGDIVVETIRRNDDTLVFFGQLLDHGPGSPTGREWIERLNRIHAHFPLRNSDSLYTLATLALDAEAITARAGITLFSPSELEAHWQFWRSVAEHQHLTDIPDTREDLRAWAADYEATEYATTHDGREIATALVTGFGERCLPRALRRWDGQIIAALCPPRLREVHELPAPSIVVTSLVRVALRLYALTVDVRRVPAERSMAQDFGTARYGERPPEDVGYQRHPTQGATRSRSHR